MTTITIATTVWGRPEITRAVLNYYSDLDVDGVRFEHLAIATRGDPSAHVARRAGFAVAYAPNEPLNEKHNRMAVHATERETDYVCFVNSDDVISAAYFRRCVSVFDYSDVDACGVRLMNYAMVDLATGRGAFVPDALPASGIMLTPSAIHRMAWKPWGTEPKNEMLDSALMRRIQEKDIPLTGALNSLDTPTQICAIKSDENIWSFDEHIDAVGTPTTEFEADAYLNERFPSLYESLYETDAAI